MMFLFVVSYTPLKEVNNNAAYQTYTSRCLAGNCFLFTSYRYNLKNKRASTIMALSSNDVDSNIEILWIDSNKTNSSRSLSEAKTFGRKNPMAIFANRNIYVSSI